MLFSSSRHVIFEFVPMNLSVFEISLATVSQLALIKRKFSFGLFVIFGMDYDFRERILSSEMAGNVSVLFTGDTLLPTIGSRVFSRYVLQLSKTNNVHIFKTKSSDCGRRP